MTAIVEDATVRSGLDGVVAAATRLSMVDGAVGRLLLAGYPVEEVAPRLSYEAMLHLLWTDRLPNAADTRVLSQKLAAHRRLPEVTLGVLRAAAEAGAAPMDALRAAAATLHLGGAADAASAALAVTAGLPTAVAAYHRLCAGLAPIAPRDDLGHAAAFLHMLTGALPGPARVRGLETYLNTVVDHGLNASTFTARVIVSTRSDLVSAVVGALGALKGPLHGGAPGPALDMVFEIGSRERIEQVLRAKLAAGERLMGFGHRVYKVRDPRAEVLAAEARRFFDTEGDAALFALATEVEAAAVRLLAAHKPGRNLQTNVEFYTALLLHGLGLPTSLFTPVFAMARVGGWTAHCFEQAALDRLIRPGSVYVGPVRHLAPADA